MLTMMKAECNHFIYRTEKMKSAHWREFEGPNYMTGKQRLVHSVSWKHRSMVVSTGPVNGMSHGAMALLESMMGALEH